MRNKYYGRKNEELLSSTVEEALEKAKREGVEYPIEIYEFEPEDPFEDIEEYSKDLLDRILEDLDGEYGDPDSCGTEPSPKLKDAMLEFVKVLKNEYRVFVCWRTEKKIVFDEAENEQKKK